MASLAGSESSRLLSPEGLVSFIRLKEMLKPTCLNEASLADVARSLTDIAGHIGLASIPIGCRPYRCDEASGDHCNFRNEFHADDLTIQSLPNGKTDRCSDKDLQIIGRVWPYDHIAIGCDICSVAQNASA